MPPIRRVAWSPCWRLIPSRYPEEKVFARVTDVGDLAAIEALEGMTSSRARQERGEISLVPPGDRVKGRGSAYIMAAFTYLPPSGSRFTAGTYGVYYATRAIQTGIEETRFHRERFMRRTKEGPMRLQIRALAATLDADLHDIRRMAKTFPKVYSKTSCAESQELGLKLKKAASFGIAYDSVRHAGGECAAIFRPPALSHCRQERHLIYEWDGKQIAKVFELREYMRGKE